MSNDVLALADDKLMLGHTQSDWTGLGPILEEDIASSAMAQDDLSHATVLYEALGEDPDALAFGRAAADYRCCDLVTVPDELDWAMATVRRFICAHFATIVLEDLAKGEGDIPERASRLLIEQRLQTEHLDAWIRRLGRGGDDAKGRMQHAFDTLAPHAGMLFEAIDNRADRHARWCAAIASPIADAGLTMHTDLPDESVHGGRRGTHADHFVEQHAEMTQVWAEDPTAAW